MTDHYLELEQEVLQLRASLTALAAERDEYKRKYLDCPALWCPYERQLKEAAHEQARLRTALETIAANSHEDNEWDAVEKLTENRKTALDALKTLEGTRSLPHRANSRFDVLMGVAELDLSQPYASTNPDQFPGVLYDPDVPAGVIEWRNSHGVVTLRGVYK